MLSCTLKIILLSFRRNGIRQNGIRRNGLTPSKGAAHVCVSHKQGPTSVYLPVQRAKHKNKTDNYTIESYTIPLPQLWVWSDVASGCVLLRFYVVVPKSGICPLAVLSIPWISVSL